MLMTFEQWLAGQERFVIPSACADAWKESRRATIEEVAQTLEAHGADGMVVEDIRRLKKAEEH